MENLELKVIFTGPKFLHVGILMILTGSQAHASKRQTTVSRSWVAFRPSDCDCICPMKVGKRAGGEREGAVQLRSLWLMQPQSPIILGVNLRG